MNIFLPYENSVIKSVRSLDDRRLIKQILECRQLLNVALGNSSGYANHPVAKHYKDYPGFIGTYGHIACVEYFHRFGKIHKCAYFFISCPLEWTYKCVPFYAEYPANDPRCIRTTENVSELFQQKLIRKWDTDKIPPKWTNRERPEFYK